MGQHFARHKVTLMTHQIVEQLEFPSRQVERSFAAARTAGDEIKLQVRGFETQNVRRPATTEQRANASQKFGEGKRLDQIIVGAEI
jgi:hypothetical protein